MDPSRHGKALAVLALLLGLSASYHLVMHFDQLALADRGGGDLRMRYQEIHLFWGIPMNGKEVVPYGEPMDRWDDTNYLPSSHILGILLVPPLPWPAARVYYALLDALALASVVMLGIRAAGASGAPPWLVAPAVLACTGLTQALGYGNHSIIVLALLSWAVFALASGRRISAALLLAMATVKPVLCVPLFVALLMYRQWMVLAWSGAVSAGALAYGFLSDKARLAEHIGNYWTRGMEQMYRGGGLNTLLLAAHVPERWVAPAGLVAVAIGFWALARFRPLLFRENPLVFLALVCFAGRAWFPALPYDNGMLVPLLIAMMTETCRNPLPGSVLATACLGLSLWMPELWTYDLLVRKLVWVPWLCAVALICASLRRASATRSCVSQAPRQ